MKDSIRYAKLELYFFNLISFLFFLFNLFFNFENLGLGFKLTLQSCCHTSVTSDKMAIEIVTSHEITKKSIEESRTIMLYNMCNTC